jgi:hypothetical protein
MYSTTADMARYVAALLRIAANEQGSVLRPETLATMFRPYFQPDPRVPGMGLAFELGDEGGQRTVGKTGILSGFHSAVALAPQERIGVVAFSNTGGLDGRGAPTPLAPMLLRLLLGLSVDPVRIDVPPRPENWDEICGWYSPAPGPVTNLFLRILWGAGAEVVVQGGHLMLKPLTPIPAMRRGFRLYPDDPDDPWVFRIYFPEFGMNFRVEGTATRLVMDVMSFERRPDVRNPRPWVTSGLAVGTAALVVRSVLRRRRAVSVPLGR